ncbi:MAG: hypothetical protein C0601_10710 [Candidatus Muiribacterium halophilum]|uniref:Uncharacterized protein n=1 Tax=Muiribacterium halophilum TaxID=2053465 RepID=A0A2N5ZBQ7_MUIH1|nr:MAG: hypothetical protein C0601_10710 [Candidatus Muirbacterium halophilum]
MKKIFLISFIILMITFSININAKSMGDQMTHDILMSLEKAGFDTTDKLGSVLAADINKTVNKDMSALTKQMNSLGGNINKVVMKNLNKKSSPEELTNELLKISDDIVKKSMVMANNIGPDLIKVINSHLEETYPGNLEEIDTLTKAILDNIDKQLSPVIKKIGNITPVVLKNVNAIVKEYSTLGPEISSQVLKDLGPLIKSSSHLGTNISKTVLSNLDLKNLSDSIPKDILNNIDLKSIDTGTDDLSDAMDDLGDTMDDLGDTLDNLDLGY